MSGLSSAASVSVLPSAPSSSAPARISAAEAAASLKQRKAEHAQRAALYHQSRLRSQGRVTPSAAPSSAPSSASVDPVAEVLARLDVSSSQGYDSFVASFGTDVQRVGTDGRNELTLRAQRMAAKEQAGNAAAAPAGSIESSARTPPSGSDLIVPAPRAAVASSSPVPAVSAAGLGSDLVLLMRMLAEDKERLAERTRLVTGNEEEEDGGEGGDSSGSMLRPLRRPAAAAAAGGAMVASLGDHIRVDDSYGFAPDPFAPESRTDAEDRDDEGSASDSDERQARVRVLGHDDAEGGHSDDDADADGDALHVESGVGLSEEEAGASLESVPVADDYAYDATRDRMDLKEFRARQAERNGGATHAQQQQRQQHKSKRATVSVLPDDHDDSTDADDAKLPSAPPSAADRTTSRLGADEAVAARRAAADAAALAAGLPIEPVGEASDEVEAFSYRPPTYDPHADEEEEEEEEEEAQQQQQAADAAKKAQSTTPRVVHRPIEHIPSADALAPSTVPSSSPASALPSSLPPSAARLLMSRPVLNTVSAAAFSSDDEGDEEEEEHGGRAAHVDDGVETLDLSLVPTTRTSTLARMEGEATASASTAAASSSSASASAVAGVAAAAAAPVAPASPSRPPLTSVGNYLSRAEQMGFDADLASAHSDRGSDSDSEAEGLPQPRAGAATAELDLDDDDDDVSEEEGEWMSMEEARRQGAGNESAANTKPKPTASYVPFANGQRTRRPMIAAAQTAAAASAEETKSSS